MGSGLRPDSPLEIADPPGTQARLLCELLVGQPTRQAIPLEQGSKCRRLVRRHVPIVLQAALQTLVTGSVSRLSVYCQPPQPFAWVMREFVPGQSRRRTPDWTSVRWK